ncbi:hypothetical protein LX15_002998 [Streptoalloteichus tenebrarius]|uniref:Transposase n=1 Tax=Streptoalloteichus tenebrarius (strain ATCC 17920 / DSM 40477 / JCM 4838 / CBS 697.72 / NBRC 16177 / NCIMB 11028 / NRRL B-12390 / A12253. 1 / ISP 5477) TaxID=1933 RepID=A0ABT1HUZ4_STRSD|nr:hypothetical protein [Streptoalloteichus tenebrarius]BFE99058.1 hypothetical protein GCM10020241_07340 [Streptoalloteichus tenebrarius]
MINRVLVKVKTGMTRRNGIGQPGERCRQPALAVVTHRHTDNAVFEGEGD